MDGIEFFSKINETINPHAEEVTIVGYGIEENLFDSKTVPEEYLFKFIDSMGSIFNEGINPDRLDMFSFQAADNIAYSEHKFMAGYVGGKEVCRQIGGNVENPHDNYCVNYFVNSKRRAVKFYDLDIWRHQQPKLPEGISIGYPCGQGIGINSSLKDLYFTHTDISYISDFYKLPPPFEPSIASFCRDKKIVKAFGLTYDSLTFKPLKLKLYYYPKDPETNFMMTDEKV